MDFWTVLSTTMYFVVSPLTLILLIMMVLHSNQQQAASDSQQLVALARTHGWCHDNVQQGDMTYRLFSPEGAALEWELWHELNWRESATPPSFAWRCQLGVQAANLQIHLGPKGRYRTGQRAGRSPDDQLFARTLLRQSQNASAEFADQFHNFLLHAHELPVSDPVLAARSQIIVPSVALGHAVFTRAIIEKLIRWPGTEDGFNPKRHVFLHVFHGQLVLEVRHHNFSPELCVHMVDTGIAIAANIVQPQMQREIGDLK